VHPGACSPSRSVVSKTRTRRTSSSCAVVGWLTVRRRLGDRLARAPARWVPTAGPSAPGTDSSLAACSAASRPCGRTGARRRWSRACAGELLGGLERRRTWLRRWCGGEARSPSRAGTRRTILVRGRWRAHTKTAPHRCREGPSATSAPRYSVRPPKHEIPRPIIIIRPRELLRRRTLWRDMVRSVYPGRGGRQGSGRPTPARVTPAATS
jgi:hypothetical protein